MNEFKVSPALIAEDDQDEAAGRDWFATQSADQCSLLLDSIAAMVRSGDPKLMVIGKLARLKLSEFFRQRFGDSQ